MLTLASLVIKFKLTSQGKELYLVMYVLLTSFLIPVEHPTAGLLAVLLLPGVQPATAKGERRELVLEMLAIV